MSRLLCGKKKPPLLKAAESPTASGGFPRGRQSLFVKGGVKARSGKANGAWLLLGMAMSLGKLVVRIPGLC